MDELDSIVAAETLKQGTTELRYRVVLGKWWVTALLEGEGVGYTTDSADAGSWAHHGKAMEVARTVTERTGQDAWVEVVVEPAYPRVWRLR